MDFKDFAELNGFYNLKNRDRTDLSDDEHSAYVQSAFDLYEKGGFRNTFQSPYSDSAERNGTSFTVVRRANEEDCDLEVLPMWIIRFGDGKETTAYPEEICLLEQS